MAVDSQARSPASGKPPSGLRWPPGVKPAAFRPRLLEHLPGYDRATFARDLGAGLTVGVVALPLAMAFAIASGVKPEQGLITAILAGFLISALGGSSVQIGGPAGAFIVVVYAIVERYGLTNLLISTAMAGVLLFLLGFFKLGQLVRYVPVPIVVGFTNGIAVLIALSQVKDLLGLQVGKWPADFVAQIESLSQNLHSLNLWALALGMAVLALVVVWPRPPRPGAGSGEAGDAPEAATAPTPKRSAAWRVWAARCPGPVVALALAGLATALWQLPVETIGSRFGGIPQTLPSLDLPPFSWETAKQLVAPTITIALLGAIESLLCARVADTVSGHTSAEQGLPPLRRHDPNQELMAQGVANIASPLFGGLPATGTIARTVTNIRSGGRTPISGLVHALTLLVIVLVAAPLAAHVPLAALAGILLFVAWNMGEWRAFAHLRQFNWPYRVLLVGTFVLTVVTDLTVAVQVGLALACLFFVVRMGGLFRVSALALPEGVAMPADVVVRELYGALFFGAVGKIEALEAELPTGTRALVFTAHRLVWMDASGLDALRSLHETLERRGIELYLVGLAEQPASLAARSGWAERLGEGRRHADLQGAAQALRHGSVGSTRHGATGEAPVHS
jgi:sulfate permease, SulP family